MSYVILFKDRSGVFGKWYEEGNDMRFEREYKDIDLTEKEMEYALSELKKIKEGNWN